MSGFVWLASYPKSGNTWFRLLLANLFSNDPYPADINQLPSEIASSRRTFDYLTLIESGLLTADEADSLRPSVYKELANGAPGDECDIVRPIRFLKVHDAYARNVLDGARAAILIVRDPRAIAPSLANHNGTSIDAAIDLLNDANAAAFSGTDNQPPQLRWKIPGWSGHTQSWLDQRDIPVHFVRYEDLARDTVNVFTAAMDFAGHSIARADAERAAKFSNFSRAKAQEREHGFAEAARRGSIFFRKGEADAWRNELSAAQIARIEEAHGPMMRQLGYSEAGCCEP